MSSSKEESFWTRMNHASSAHDLPQLSATPKAPATLPIELLICTYAGKPLTHFAFPPNLPRRPLQSLVTLSATLVAFQAQNEVRDVTSSEGRLVSVVHNCFHAMAFTHDSSFPIPLLRTLVRSALTIVYSTLSSAIIAHLHTFPNADTSNLTPLVSPLLDTVLVDVITHPLPHVIQKAASLPAPVPSMRSPVAPLLRSALCKFPTITHALVMTACAPFPRRLISVAHPANFQLSDADLLTVMSIPPYRANAKCEIPNSLFLQTGGFRTPFKAHARSFELRLDPDDYEAFKEAVGGSEWRPEWTSAGGDVVWLLALSTPASDEGDKFLDHVEDILDRSTAARDLMISMEKRWSLDDIEGIADVKHHIKGVVLINRHRIVGTIGAFTHANGVAMMRCLLQPGELGVERSQTWTSVHLARVQLRALCWEKRYIVCTEDCMSLPDVIGMMQDKIVPWLKKFTDSLVPDQDRITVQPATPLSGLFSPFDS
eukprot:TRINITY_DN188_c0_g1_i7.p1 TRINITY_DN188_c0_g1~~TRINITY_DN188_c0_g1_i7.p1  ORF type:complete len:485 (+),score=46.00 TRINITY_DN188_c0_g1_i7:4404-5858(+)